MDLSRWKDVWARFSGRGAYPHELSLFLLLPLRRLLLSPERLVRQLHLSGDSRVLELGPGPGFFSIAVARAVPRGRLELVDLQREMLAKARRRLRRAGVRNAGCVQADATRLPFGSGSFDVAFLVAVLGEVPDASACLSSIASVLRPGGLLSVSELPGDPDALSQAEVRALAQAAGLEPVECAPLLRGFIATFRRPG